MKFFNKFLSQELSISYSRVIDFRRTMLFSIQKKGDYNQKEGEVMNQADLFHFKMCVLDLASSQKI